MKNAKSLLFKLNKHIIKICKYFKNQRLVKIAKKIVRKKVIQMEQKDIQSNQI